MLFLAFGSFAVFELSERRFPPLRSVLSAFASMSSEVPRSTAGPLAALLIVLVTGSVHFVGSAVLFGITSGPDGLSASPFLALFGWFFVLPELVGVTVQWVAYNPSRGARSFWRVMLVSVSIACLVMALLGPKEEGHALRWTAAYVAATAVAASWSMFLVAGGKRFVIAVRTSGCTE
jgi:hypothetical protein